MQDLSSADAGLFRDVRFVLTDMDETLTLGGRLAAETYTALQRLQQAGLKVIPVTAAPAGWCDQMARMWPVDGVIGENGGFFFQRTARHDLERMFWHAATERPEIEQRLKKITADVLDQVPEISLAQDQPFRLTSVAFAQPDDAGIRQRTLDALKTAGAQVTTNNLWILGWLGPYDKLAMAQRVLKEQYRVDVAYDRDTVVYVGDSANDAPMFDFFRHTVGVSTVRNCLVDIPTPPAWITAGPGGIGFVETTDAILAAR